MRATEVAPTGSVARGVGWSLLAALFAAAFLVPYRYSVELAPRGTAMTAMFVVAVVFNGAVAFAQVGHRMLRFDRVAGVLAIALAAFTIAGNLGIGGALPDIGAGMTSVVLKAQVILTPALAVFLLSERAPSRLWVGGCVALLGVAAPQWLAAEPRGTVGYAWALLGATAFALMQIVTRRVIDRIQPAAVNALRLVLAVIVLHGWPEGRAAWSASWTLWAAAGLAGILGPGVSRLCLMAALHHVSPSLTALIALIGTVFAFLFGFFFFGETPSGLELAGAT
ncbi:MAG: DMT family transporter, partial [Myxococcota bacterium]